MGKKPNSGSTRPLVNTRRGGRNLALDISGAEGGGWGGEEEKKLVEQKCRARLEMVRRFINHEPYV